MFLAFTPVECGFDISLNRRLGLVQSADGLHYRASHLAETFRRTLIGQILSRMIGWIIDIDKQNYWQTFLKKRSVIVRNTPRFFIEESCQMNSLCRLPNSLNDARRFFGGCSFFPNL